jgi:signal transduction histidine kinase
MSMRPAYTHYSRRMADLDSIRIFQSALPDGVPEATPSYHNYLTTTATGAMFASLRKRFVNKIMAVVILSILLVMGTEIVLRVYFGTRDRMKLIAVLETDLAATTYAGIKYPMSVGDSKGVETFLAGLKTKIKDIEVYICDFDQNIILSTQKDNINTKLTKSITSEVFINTLNQTFQSGTTPAPIHFEQGDKEYLITIQPLLNNENCYHCHGSTRKVIGGMVIKTGLQQAFASVAVARNRTILITAIGISTIIVLIYTMVTRLVQRPVERLAEGAKRFAAGNMSVSIDVHTVDEIGVLADAFNDMVRKISSFSKELAQEVAQKTALLNEKATLIGLLEKANTELRELDSQKSLFLANMSHELRMPMSSIIGFSELLSDGIDGPVNEEQKKTLAKITSNAKDLLQLINDILDLSKIESGRSELAVSRFNLKELIYSVTPIFETIIKQKNLTLTVEVAEDLPHVYGDEDKIKHVLLNLMTNAIKFTSKGGITIRAAISKRGVQLDGVPVFAEVMVEDTGIGIKEEDIDKIFNKFVQVDASMTRRYKGTGLGLSIAKGIVALHNGVIWATSKYGLGSTFHFTIPIQNRILQKPFTPYLEYQSAHALADYFDRPVQNFLKKPELAGTKLRCWEHIKCNEPSCPAYGHDESRCWLVFGTHCAGLRIASFPEKVEICKNCEVLRKFVIDLPDSGPETTDTSRVKNKQNPAPPETRAQDGQNSPIEKFATLQETVADGKEQDTDH